MKKVALSILAAAALFACSEAKKEETASPIEHIYKPTYTDNFKIGDQKNVLLAEKFHPEMNLLKPNSHPLSPLESIE